jgi:hypothetical protein
MIRTVMASLPLLLQSKTSADQTVCQKVGDPDRIADIGLATRNIVYVSGIGQNQLEIAVTQNVPDRRPVDPGRLHGYMGATHIGQPRQQEQQPRRSCDPRVCCTWAEVPRHSLRGSQRPTRFEISDDSRWLESCDNQSSPRRSFSARQSIIRRRHDFCGSTPLRYSAYTIDAEGSVVTFAGGSRCQQALQCEMISKNGDNSRFEAP